jgi:hypothetical protein
MANIKISALSASTTPLAGTEVLPIVQSSTTKQVSVANLTAGRAISATSVTASTGNFVVGTSGQGIDFSATPGTGTSELLNDYEEGTFTPTLLSDGAQVGRTYSIQNGRYTRIGNRVIFNIYLNLSAKGSSTGSTQIGGLPFTSGTLEGVSSIIVSNVTYSGQINTIIAAGNTLINVYMQQTASAITFLPDTGLANNSLLILSGQYIV